MSITTINPTLRSSPFTHHRFQLKYPTRTKLLFFFFFNGRALSTRHPILTLRCSSSSSEQQREEAGSLKEVLSGMVDERVEQLLNKQENRVLLDGLENATQRVEMAKRELAEFDRQQTEAKHARDYINQLQSKASEIEECQKEILEARAMVEEAERALQSGGVGGREGLTASEIEAINKNEDRLESIKAGAIAAIVGTLAGLPISFTQVTSTSQLILPTAITFVSCALFGVTFRYAVRKDLDDFNLKTGTAAAFGVVKGLATLGGGPPLELEVASLLSHAFNGAIYVSQSLLVYLFAAVSLDYCIKLRILSSFPIDRSGSSTTME
ncbi:hypothetical protein LguiB_028999 [Lonicera macranthoides]